MKGLRRIIYNYVDRTFLSGCSSYNSLEVRKSCRTKVQAREMFKKNGVPHALGGTFFWPFSVFRFADSYGFPLVVKPNVSGFSRGSHFPINNRWELLKAAFLVKVWWPVSICEQYHHGKNYRVTVVDGEIMSIIERFPPYVDGDGVSNIAELIDRENAIRDEMKLFPVIYPLQKNGKVQSFLKRQGMSLSTVPSAGERIFLHNKIALAPGGTVNIVAKDSVHPDNTELFLRVLELFEANILGIDAIFEDGLHESYQNQRCALLEVNSRPYLKMHEFPRHGNKEDLSSYFAKLETIKVADQDIY